MQRCNVHVHASVQLRAHVDCVHSSAYIDMTVTQAVCEVNAVWGVPEVKLADARVQSKQTPPPIAFANTMVPHARLSCVRITCSLPSVQDAPPCKAGLAVTAKDEGNAPPIPFSWMYDMGLSITADASTAVEAYAVELVCMLTCIAKDTCATNYE